MDSCHFNDLKWPWKLLACCKAFQVQFNEHLCNISHGFNWHSASRGPSAIAEAELLVLLVIFFKVHKSECGIQCGIGYKCRSVGSNIFMEHRSRLLGSNQWVHFTHRNWFSGCGTGSLTEMVFWGNWLLNNHTVLLILQYRKCYNVLEGEKRARRRQLKNCTWKYFLRPDKKGSNTQYSVNVLNLSMVAQRCRFSAERPMR